MVIRVLDLFCGTGGFASGVCGGLGETAKVFAGIDNLPCAIETFKANHQKSYALCVDIRKLTPKQLISETENVKIDLIIGGPPCQGFSSIRPNRSTNKGDIRNTLYEAYFEFIDFFKPKIFIMENVVGLATHNDGKTIKAILERAKKAGYSVDWRIINAATFGVPQRRERLLLLGRIDNKIPEFPAPTHYSNGSTIGYKDKSKMIIASQTLADFAIKLKKSISALEAISDLPVLNAGEESTKYECKPQNDFQKKMRKNQQHLSLHYATDHSKNMLEIIKHSGFNRNHLPPGLTSSGFSTSYSRIEPDLPAPTITGNFPFPGSNKCIHPFQNRAITPREAARLQSFPDDYIFVGNKSEIAKQIGNAVPFLLGFAIGKHIKKIFN